MGAGGSQHYLYINSDFIYLLVTSGGTTWPKSSGLILTHFTSTNRPTLLIHITFFPLLALHLADDFAFVFEDYNLITELVSLDLYIHTYICSAPDNYFL